MFLFLVITDMYYAQSVPVDMSHVLVLETCLKLSQDVSVDMSTDQTWPAGLLRYQYRRSQVFQSELDTLRNILMVWPH